MDTRSKKSHDDIGDGVSHHASNKPLQILVLGLVFILLGTRISFFTVYALLFFCFKYNFPTIDPNIEEQAKIQAESELQKQQQREQRDHDVRTITASISENILRFVIEDRERIDSARKTALQNQKKDVAEIVNRICDYLADQKKQEEGRKDPLPAEEDNPQINNQPLLSIQSPPLQPPPSKQNHLPHPISTYNPLSPNFTCIGTTKKGTRCGQSYLSKSDLQNASMRLQQMSSPYASEDLFTLESLVELVDWMLCPRWHRDRLPQGDIIAKQWLRLLKPGVGVANTNVNANALGGRSYGYDGQGVFDSRKLFPSSSFASTSTSTSTPFTWGASTGSAGSGSYFSVSDYSTGPIGPFGK